MGNMFLAASSAASKSRSGSLNILLIVVVLFGVLYFVMIRPQRNRQRKAQEQQNAVTPGSGCAPRPGCTPPLSAWTGTT